MALQIRNIFTKLRRIIKSESKWRHHATYTTSEAMYYKHDLKNLKDTETYHNFQHYHFTMYATEELKSLILELFESKKKKELMNNVDAYNSIIKSFVINDINFDANQLLKEMRDYKIELNKETFSLLIKHYCNLGEMKIVENLTKEMKSHNEVICLNNQIEIIKGYMVAGQPKMSKNYIIENNLNEDDPDISIALLMGYSSMGEIDMVMENISKMKNNNINIQSSNYFQFYIRLAQANVSYSNLIKILKEMPFARTMEITSAILSLNRLGLFGHSLKLAKIFRARLEEFTLKMDLLRSYCSTNCPQEIKREAIQYLLQFKFKFIYPKLLALMNFNKAILFVKGDMNEYNRIHIIPLVLDIAIKEKSLHKINTVLCFAKTKLNSAYFSSILQIHYIPSMLNSRMASDLQQLINCLPFFQFDVLRASLFYCLVNKDFQLFENIRTTYNCVNISCYVNISDFVKEIDKNYKSMEDLNKLSSIISITFDAEFANLLLMEIISCKIIYSSKLDDIEQIHNAVKLAKNFNVSFNTYCYEQIWDQAPRYAKIFKCMFETN